MTQLKTLLQEQVHLLADNAGEHQSARFFRLSFSLPEQCVHLRITLQPDSPQPVQLPLCLFDPTGDVRLMKAGHRVTSESMVFDLAEDAACAGGIPGRICAGEWKLVVYKRRMCQDIPAEVTIQYEQGTVNAQAESVTLDFAQACLDTRAGWYQGELHTHSNESTGRTSIREVVDAAKEYDLDFLALTDHFTAAHWRTLQTVYDGQKPLLLQSMEVSGDRGHANLHGLTQWMNPLVDDNDELAEFLHMARKPSMEQLADDTHAQGGLVCINHPLSGEMGWRYHDFDLHKADLVEVWCLSEQDATLPYPTYYDMLLARGYHLTAVGSSDSHHPTRPGPWQLGQVRTFIYAEALSQQALLKGLKAGHAYVSVQGSRMNMTGRCGEQQVMMGDTLCVMADQPVQITVELLQHPKGNLFVYLNGQLLESCYVDHENPTALNFTLPEKLQDGYVRAEFYEVEGTLPYYGYSWRDWHSLRLISNPIYLSRGV